ncbi:zinc ribbon domain-containing protein [Sulfitobacter sp. SK011]
MEHRFRITRCRSCGRHSMPPTSSDNSTTRSTLKPWSAALAP